MQKILLVAAMLILAALIGLTGAVGTSTADYALAEPACHLFSGTCDPFYINRFTGCAFAMLFAFGLLLMACGKFQTIR